MSRMMHLASAREFPPISANAGCGGFGGAVKAVASAGAEDGGEANILRSDGRVNNVGIRV
jgi:hypothetical protein